MASRLLNPVGWGCGLVIGAAATLAFVAAAGEVEGWFGTHFGWVLPLLGLLLLGPPLSLAFDAIWRAVRSANPPPGSEDETDYDA